MPQAKALIVRGPSCSKNSRHKKKVEQDVGRTTSIGRWGTPLALAATISFVATPGPTQNVAVPGTPNFPVEDQPSLNFYGLPGLIDMPSAQPMPNGQLAVGISSFGGQTRTTLSFQFSPRISASFRYIGIQDWNDNGFGTYRDRSFDVRFLISKETKRWPAITVGLQDFAGTGIYAGEYIVASKNFAQPLGLPGRMTVSAGLGWGRLGSSGSIGSISDLPSFDPGDTGGELSTDQWFRGDFAPFGGIEWQVNERFGLKLEYSSDAYEPETSRGVFESASRINFGAEYQINRDVRLGAYYLYGSEFGVNAQIQFNPRYAPTPLTIAGPRPVIVRPSRESNPAAWSTGWADSQSAPATIRGAMAPELEEDGIRINALSVSAHTAELRIVNTRFGSDSIAIGRTARAMARVLPASVETFRITLVRSDLSVSTTTIQRRDLETLEYQPNAAGRLLVRTGFDEASPDLPGAYVPDDLYPRFSWFVGPYLSPSYFDPDEPVRADAGIRASFKYNFAPGWEVSGEARQRIVGNVDDGRLSDSVLPRVRTNAVLYAQEGETTLENLYVSRVWKPADDVYARVTAGYLESMFGGVSTELLWKPVDSRLAIGAAANYVQQREFDQLLGFQDYDVATGHLSAYYQFDGGYTGQVDVGRYLAGDVGATFTLSRDFINCWKVGGFFTLTDVSSEEFGEGSFDKGINLPIPISWFTGQPSTRSVSTTIRPVQRDGGARLSVPGRLYETVREGHRLNVSNDWSQVWE